MPDDPPPASQTTGLGSENVNRVVEHMFRHEYQKLVAILVHRLGPRNLPLAEDLVQDALLRAMQSWPFHGIPPNPTAWLLTTARNRATDLLRRSQVWQAKQDEIAHLLHELPEPSSAAPASPRFEEEIQDNVLRMIFVCCHPEIPPDSQVALALRTLVGFSEPEIAAAYLIPVPTVRKRLVRARQKLRDLKISAELPAPDQLHPRLDSVLQTLYLLFNEGYKASSGDALLRSDLCAEALRLATLLSQHPLGQRSDLAALIALMQFNIAREPSRATSDGTPLLLHEQDRALWDRPLIAAALQNLTQSQTGDRLTRYHLEAGIAACHCLADSYQTTHWAQIVTLYDGLLQLAPSPIVSIHRSIALAQRDGPESGLRSLDSIEPKSAIDDNYLYHAARAEMLRDTQQSTLARDAYEKAISLCPTTAERSILLRKKADLPN